MIVAALVGMAGAGKSEAARLFMNNGFIRIRFGDITDEEIKKRGLVLNEENPGQVSTWQSVLYPASLSPIAGS